MLPFCASRRQLLREGGRGLVIAQRCERVSVAQRTQPLIG